MSQLAIIRIRGSIGLRKDVVATFNMLNLQRKNYCTLVPSTPEVKGMINTVKDYVTWGEVDDATVKLLVEKRGEAYKEGKQDPKGIIKRKNYLEIAGKKFKKYFRLQPPQKGYGRKGVKVGFNAGGALGDRGKEINPLIQNMVR